MHEVAMLTLFFIYAVSVVSTCKPDCSRVRCKDPDCPSGYEPFTPSCDCCMDCRKIEGPNCEKPCPLINCIQGYEAVEVPGKCCKECRKIKEECPEYCSEEEIWRCPQIRCMEGYKLVREECGCCNVCKKIKDTCRTNEVYDECGSACPPTCASLRKSDQVCTLQCVPGCFCRKGLVKNDDGECVRPRQCPKNTCPENEVYNECGTACPVTCANLGANNQVCTAQCVKGCFCEEGVVRNDAGKCVQSSQCPKRTCPENEVYNECGTACPVTCANLGANYQACTKQCVKGCFCEEGLVRNDAGKCVQSSQCPKRTCQNNSDNSDSESDEGY